jgi:sensor c-di-GMP phosphodiesterase-like protein
MQKPFRPNDLRKILTTLLEADAPRATEQQAAPIHDLRIEDLAQGLARQELVVHFQPKMSVNDETLVGFEALVRWQHPQLGLLYPSAFIDLAEKSGLALPFTYAVLNTAIASSRQIF